MAEFNPEEQEALLFFSSLKKQYETDRQPYEWGWKQALSAVYVGSQTGEDKLDKVYNGLANIESPIMNVKVNGIVSRINRILFNVKPIGRIEDTLVAGSQQKNIVDLWNSYIFDYQLDQIGFEQAYKLFQKNKAIQGTAFAHISQEFEEKDISFFDENKPETVTVKDNTFFRNLLITEFYSDVSKEDINDSQACIYSRAVSMEELKANEKRTITETFEVIEPILDEQGNIIGEKVIGEEQQTKEIGLYHNLELLESAVDNVTPEQAEYIQWLGLNKGSTSDFKRALKDTKKTGFVQLDECYGKFPLDGEVQEVLCTIANGRVIVRLDPTPFKHRKYVRPFVRGVYKSIPNSLYGESNVVLGLNLLQELNASRSQASDAKTFSIFPMTYVDQSKSTINKWDGQIRPRGKIEGTGPKGIDFVVQPYLGSIGIQDSNIIQADMNQLWSLSPVQEGASDSRLIPKTAGATRAIIAQNDMPLNDIINNAINNELKPFIEMLYERNLVFKTVQDLSKVWTEQQIQEAGFQTQRDAEGELSILNKEGEEVVMRDFLFDISVKLLGNLELSNEIAHQNGWIQYGQLAQQIPPLAKRTDWKRFGEKVLESFGIKDDSEGLWHSDEVMAQIDAEQAKANNQSLQQQADQQEQARQAQKEDYKFKVETDTESKVVVEQVKNMGKITENKAELVMEKATGQKVQ